MSSKKIEWTTEKRKISDLIEYEKNPRTLSEKQYLDLKKSLTKFDLAEIPAVNKDNMILAGHMRLRVLAELKGKDHEIDVRVPNRLLNEEEAQEYLIRSNKNTGSWDFEVLANEFEIEDLLNFGFEEFEFGIDKEDIEETEGDDDVPDVKEDAKTVKGDLYELGNHRLLCGDSTVITDVDKLMNGEKAVLSANDPPYGMKKEKDGIKNDNLNYDDLLRFNNEWIQLAFASLTENGSFYCWGTDEPLMDIYSDIIKPMIKQQQATFRNLITWNKGHGQGQLAEDFRSYPIADEKCLFVMCGVQGFNNNADNYFDGWEPIRDYLLQGRLEMGWSVPDMKRIVGHSDLSRDHWTSKSQFNMPTREVYNKMQAEADKQREKTGNDAFKKEYDELKKEYDELKKEYYSTRAYFNNTHDNMNNVWDISRTSTQERAGTGGHATPKPLELCKRIIKSSSRESDLVIDLFLGSGSTLIACEKTNRKCYGMELDEKYSDVIVKRYIDFCKKNGKPYSVKRNGKDCLSEFEAED